MILDPRETAYQNISKLLIWAVVPRPIAFVSTVSLDGVLNLAPFSYFTVVSANPPVICFCPTRRAGPEPYKDTLRNIQATGEFVVNILSEEIVRQMNICSAEYPPEIDEFQISGLTPVPSDLIKPPRVQESHIQMECRLHSTVEVSDLPGGGTLVLGQVVRFHIDEAYVDNFKIDPDKLHPVGRMGGNLYTRCIDRFELIRPKV